MTRYSFNPISFRILLISVLSFIARVIGLLLERTSLAARERAEMFLLFRENLISRHLGDFARPFIICPFVNQSIKLVSTRYNESLSASSSDSGIFSYACSSSNIRNHGYTRRNTIKHQRYPWNCGAFRNGSIADLVPEFPVLIAIWSAFNYGTSAAIFHDVNRKPILKIV